MLHLASLPSLSSILIGAVLLPAAALAQVGGPIATGNSQLTVSSQGNWRRNLAVAPDGALWTLGRESDAAGTRLLLHFSNDGGATWIQFPGGGTQTVDDGSGAIGFGVDCNRLHVAWHARDGGMFSSVYYATFNTANATWDGPPQQLIAGTGPNDQYYVSDVEVTESGNVVVVISSHRAPSSPNLSAWSTGLFVKPRGGNFGAVMQVNTDAFGQSPDAQAIGDVVHLAFRTNTGAYGTRYRAFDTASMQFETASDIQVEAGTSNTSCIAAATDGGLYVVYNGGSSAPGNGEIRVAFAAPGAYTTWTTQTVAADPDLQIGNVGYSHFSLATLDSGVVAVIYSKRSVEQHQTLYFRLMTSGMLRTPETVLASSTDPDRYAVVAGVRNTRNQMVLSAVVESRAAVHPGRLVEFFTPTDAGRTVRYGRSCQGALPDLPRLRVDAPPASGRRTRVLLSGLPATRPGALWIGVGCNATAVPLDAIGMPGCALFQRTPLSVTYAASASGDASISLPIPSPTTLGRLPITFQSFVLAPGANALGGVVTNNVSIWLP